MAARLLRGVRLSLDSAHGPQHGVPLSGRLFCRRRRRPRSWLLWLLLLVVGDVH
jgi:hypothetical protein